MVTGRVISHYQLLDRIGRGHEREVYRARDLRLDRDVAIELLTPAETARAETRERFRREARIASLVSHPHICAVHDSGEEDGRAFLVTELLDGQTLDEQIVGRPLPLDTLIELAIQLVDALAAVHRRGIVHGNLKPSNVFVTTQGHVKLLEVGLMSAWWETAAGTSGVADGSSPTKSVERRAPLAPGFVTFHAYQSPEQVSGDRLDHRSDLFSAGAVLYEMATGQRAFAGHSQGETAAAIIGGGYAPAKVRNPLLPDGICRIIDRTLERSPDARYQTAADLLADLRQARRRLELAPMEPVAVRHGARRPALAAVAALVVAAVTLAAWWWPRATVSSTRHSLLVGSIANGTNDPDFDGTLRQALTVHLGQSPYLDIVADEPMRQTLEMMGRVPDAAIPHEVARELCQRLGVEAMLEGSVSAVGRLTIVALVASDCGTGEIIVRDQVEVERKEDVLREVGRLASTMRTSLGESMASLQSHDVPIEEGTTPSLEALKAYTAGVMQRAAGHEIDSIHAFERAIELDPEFALAYTTLSSVYGGLGETRRGEEFAQRAYEHRDSISERERLFVTYQFHDRVTGDQLKARETLEVWKQSFPRDYRPANALAVLLNRLGDYDRAILEAQDAIKRNPAHSFPYSSLAYAYRGAGQFDKARETASAAVSRGIATLPTRRLLYQMAEMEGNAAAADEHFAWAQTRARTFDLVGARAQVAAYRGRMRDSRDLYKQTIDLASTTGFALIGTGYAAQAALTEALYGYSGPAIAQATSLAASEEYAPALRAATALALAGSTAAAELIVRRFRNERPQDTILHAVYLPLAEAALLLSRDRPAEAIEALRRAAPYERGTVAALLPMYLRGEAYRRIGSHSDAAREFGAVLQNRGAEPFSPVLPLAHLGLGRALALAGDEPGSRRAFDELRSIWREADTDLPVGIGMVDGKW